MTHRITPSSAADVHRRRRWTLAAVAGLLVLGAGTATVYATTNGSGDPVSPPAVTSSTDGGASDPGLAFGVLGSHCNAHRASALAAAGVSYAELGLDWSQFEPEQGSFDHDYEQDVVRAVHACTDAGIGVVLTPGFHSAPSWVADLPEGSYVDQGGGQGSEYVPNLVFSAAVRDAVTGYLTELNGLVGLNSMAAIRVGTGTNGELGYPQSDTDTDNPFWAFDDAAQSGEGLAQGAAVTPMPGWTPGSSTWNGRPVDYDQAKTWFTWYSDSVADAVVWVVRELRDLGYTGDINLPLAGRGALPADLTQSLGALLDGTANRDGSFEAGLFYPEQLPRIAQSLAQTEQPGWGAIVADSASVDDATATYARHLSPPQDSCQPGDADLDLLDDADVGNWPSFRWTVANARKAGLEVMGENPGSPELAGTGGNDDTDSAEQQMVHAPEYAKGCGMRVLMWAFEDDLFGDGGADLDAYAAQIQAYGAGNRRPAGRTKRRGQTR
jgi:hypothetical protein